MQGAGNDFVLVETGDGHNQWSKMARAVCDRHFGVGADGLLLMMPSDRADCRMRIFNADGSESSACGNGLRCLVKHYIDISTNKASADEISVETLAGVRKARIRHTNGRIAEIQVGMGQPSIGQAGTPGVSLRGGNKDDITRAMAYHLTIDRKELDLNLVSIGNPHAVYFLEQSVADYPLHRIGQMVEHHPAFPGEINYEVVNIRNRSEVEARVWERGVGETLACGSGACAISIAACLLGYTEERVDVRLPGGVLSVEWNGSGEVYLSGPAETVFVGEWS